MSNCPIKKFDSVAASSGVCWVKTLSAPFRPLIMVLALFMIDLLAYKSPTRLLEPAYASIRRTRPNNAGSRDFTPATSRQSISLRTREVSCSKRRAYRTARRTLSLSRMSGCLHMRMTSSRAPAAEIFVAGLARSCSISDSSSRRRLPAMSDRLLIRFTCLVTLDCRLVKSMCSVTKRRMSSSDSTCLCWASRLWYCSIKAFTLTPTSPNVK
mmetsp:Transcript_19696/g.54991  ORF Transcript_19696/g.54991 Transcript_19696/m.54991 type:complete len:212 (+) Transcript_19696:803-1438(+)